MKKDLLDVARFINRLRSNLFFYPISLFIFLSIAFYLNNWKLKKIYSSNTTIKVNDNASHYGSTNTYSNSINFIWGTGNDKIEALSYILTSRAHNYKIVRRTNSFIFYYNKKRFNTTNIYKLDSPFNINIDESHIQTIGHDINIKPLDKYRFYIIHNKNQDGFLYDYSKDKIYKNFIKNNYPSIGYYGKWIIGKNYKFCVSKTNIPYEDNNIYFKLVSTKQAVDRCLKGLHVDRLSKLSNIIVLDKKSESLNEAVDMLNNSISILIDHEMEERTLSAINTRRYLHENINVIKRKLDNSSSNLQNLQNKTGIYSFDFNKQDLLSSISALDKEKIELNDKITALDRLSKSKYNQNDILGLNIPGLNSNFIIQNINDISLLETKKNELLKVFRYDTEEVKLVDNSINKIKYSLTKTVNSYRDKLKIDLYNINKRIKELEGKMTKLPKTEVDFISSTRRFDLNNNIYSNLVNQLYNIDISIASMVPNINIIDYAKNYGQSYIYPKVSFNYILAILLSFIIPTLYLLIIELLDKKVRNIEDITNRLDIPLIGNIPINKSNTDTVVIDSPNSIISESFRLIRSNLRFMLKNNHSDKGHVLLVTSSMPGEGKTFCSVNISCIISKIENNKCLLIDMDLRKPSIGKRIGVTSKYGLSNYLVGDVSLNQIISKSRLYNLDIITAGDIPPNPSELILGAKMDEFLDSLRLKYDYIIIDSPPMGIVSDSIDILSLVDCVLYVVRNNYTDISFIDSINTKYNNVINSKNTALIFNGVKSHKRKYNYYYAGYNIQ